MISCDKCGNRTEWLQVDSDAGGRWGVRSFYCRFDIKVTSGWRAVEKREGIGERRAILCASCKASLDSELTQELFEQEALRGTPLIFVAPDRVDLDRAIAEVKRTYGEGEGVVAVLESDRKREAKTVPLDSLKWLAPAARDAVQHKYGKPGKPVTLYRHQAKAIGAVRRGGSVVLSTATSSGKSLCFQLPFLHDIAATSDPHKRPAVLYLAPLNALIGDQFRSLKEFGTAKRETGAVAEFLQTVTIGGGDTCFVAAQYHGGVRVEGDDAQNSATGKLRRQIRSAKPNSCSRIRKCWQGPSCH